jgi:hypothetical protein
MALLNYLLFHMRIYYFKINCHYEIRQTKFYPGIPGQNTSFEKSYWKGADQLLLNSIWFCVVFPIRDFKENLNNIIKGFHVSADRLILLYMWYSGNS